MAYTPAVNDVIEVKNYCTTVNQNGVNVYHFKVSALAGGGCTDLEIADAIATAAAVPYKAYLPATASYAGVRVRVLNKTPPPIPQTSVLGAGAGGAAGDLMSTQTSGLLRKVTAIGGQAGRGRVYLPFPSEGQNDANGRPTVGYQGLALAVGAVMLVNKVVVVGGRSTSMVPVLYDRVDKGTTPIINYTAEGEWATQRRRSQINRPDNLGPPA